MKSNLKLQVLLSIMNEREPIKYIKKCNINCNYVIINQITNKDIKLSQKNEKGKKVFSVNDKGLSKSRNLALKNADSEICLISDDDMYYYNDLEKIIINNYKKYPDADIIAFNIISNNNRQKRKKMKEGRINFIHSLRLCSVQISFRKDSIISNNILFDNRFGSGSKYSLGEENIFLADCLKKKLKIYFVPVDIGELTNTHESTWFNGYNEKYMINRGASFYRMNHILSNFLIVQYAIRKYNLYKNNLSFFKAMKFMKYGKKLMKREI